MSEDTAPNTAQAWLEQTRDLERRGEFLRAYDIASQGLEEFPDDVWLRYRAVLVLARAGATQLARQRYAEYGLDGREEEDIAALAARLSKDVALMAPQKERAVPAASAAEQYETIYRRTSGYFPGINAATLSLVAGNADHARELAQEILSLLKDLDAGDGEEAYYRLATQAEALLIFGREDAARSTLAAAFAAVGNDLAALATTRKQLALICAVSGLSSDVLAEFIPPRVIHYCGHIIKPPGESGRFSADQEARVAEAIRDRLVQSNVGFGYGSLAAGADILFAEALLDRGAELHVALPFRKDEFIDVSVAPSGGDWVTRFERCLAAANSPRYATEDSYLGDDQLFSYCSGIGMGLVILRARYLDGPVEQIAVWDAWRLPSQSVLPSTSPSGGPSICRSRSSRSQARAMRQARDPTNLPPSVESSAPCCSAISRDSASWVTATYPSSSTRSLAVSPTSSIRSARPWSFAIPGATASLSSSSR